MRKVLFAGLTAGMLVAMGAGVAHAAPVAPRAKTTSVRGAEAFPRVCFNIDKDFRKGCFFGKQPYNQQCEPTAISIPPIFTLWRCGPITSVVPGEGCVNIDRDANQACLLGADPGNPNCRPSPVFNVPGVITYYRCGDQARALPQAKVARPLR